MFTYQNLHFVSLLEVVYKKIHRYQFITVLYHPWFPESRIYANSEWFKVYVTFRKISNYKTRDAFLDLQVERLHWSQQGFHYWEDTWLGKCSPSGWILFSRSLQAFLESGISNPLVKDRRSVMVNNEWEWKEVTWVIEFYRYNFTGQWIKHCDGNCSYTLPAASCKMQKDVSQQVIWFSSTNSLV